MNTAESMTTTTKGVPAFLETFQCEIKDQRFALVGTTMVLLMTITRGYFRRDFATDGRKWEATCGLYIRIEPADADVERAAYRPVPCIRFSNWLTSSNDMETVTLTGERRGLCLRLPNGEIESIEAAESERLIAFLGELRGIKIKYTPNLFGFLNKDGSDEAIVTEYPFPAETQGYVD